MTDMATNPEERVFQDKSGPYQLPKDAPEHERLDNQSASIVALMNYQPFHAPLAPFHPPRRILDIGCSTGAMTNLLAALFPTAEVIGVDIAPVPETRYGKRANLTYVQGDIRELAANDARFARESFDYVYQRLLIFGVAEWERYTAAIAELVAPGGWMEFHEVSCQLYSPAGARMSDSWAWYQQAHADSAALGLDIEIGDKLGDIFRATPALRNVRTQSYDYAPRARVEAPGLAGLEGQIQGLMTFVMKKFSASRAHPAEDMEKFVKDLNTTWETRIDEGDRYRMCAAIGQK